MCGIADGLRLIHIFAVTYPLSVNGLGHIRVQGDAKLSVEEGEEWYGRHGDIKPENILWFKDDPDVLDDNGILKIADFGLGRFHGRDSRSKVNPRSVLSSPTYEPPELKLGTPVSRAYDIWSLACLYLEFITWLLKGSAAIATFSERRAREVTAGFSDDNFFTITGSEEAEIRDGVIVWVNELHQHERCSALMHDLLDLIMGEMLVIDSKKRIDATALHLKLKDFVDTAEQDKKYLCEPKPRPKDSDSRVWSPSTSSVPSARKTTGKKRNVSFADPNITFPPRSQQTPPRSSLSKSDTWRTIP
jgi:serine/threonine protein kinase